MPVLDSVEAVSEDQLYAVNTQEIAQSANSDQKTQVADSAESDHKKTQIADSVSEEDESYATNTLGVGQLMSPDEKILGISTPIT